MSTFIPDQHAFLDAARAIAKLPDAARLSKCHTALARALGFRDLHQVQALQANGVACVKPTIPEKVAVISGLHHELGIDIGALLDALFRTRFFGTEADPATALSVRERLFEKNFSFSDHPFLGAPCRVVSGGASSRAMVIERVENDSDPSYAMVDKNITQCAWWEMKTHHSDHFFIPNRFWVPYGYWIEKDGAKVIFSRDYCPLWRIREGAAPERDDPDRWVEFVEQGMFHDEGAPVVELFEESLEVLRAHRVVSLPKLVEWFPKCMESRTEIVKIKYDSTRPEYRGGAGDLSR